MGIVDGKRALVVGVANDKSLAWAIAQELKAQGAEVALTYQGEILEKRVRPLAQEIGGHVVGELDVHLADAGRLHEEEHLIERIDVHLDLGTRGLSLGVDRRGREATTPSHSPRAREPEVHRNGSRNGCDRNRGRIPPKSYENSPHARVAESAFAVQ